ncbi:hypothetical protein ACFQXB_15505 [Plastorhodobacter daqingensis]|uniref:Transposase n=1 Tax=Plastorhodobacter daqingensis TaxID=1387281 RepID=A0ABW2UPY2_9RHOB
MSGANPDFRAIERNRYSVPALCHAHGVLKMVPNKTERHDARRVAQTVRTGRFKAVQIRSHDAYANRAM